jgi:hypothetical protein
VRIYNNTHLNLIAQNTYVCTNKYFSKTIYQLEFCSFTVFCFQYLRPIFQKFYVYVFFLEVQAFISVVILLLFEIRKHKFSSVFQGYVFNKTKHEEGRFPVCEDKNECSEDNGGQY